MYRVWTSLTWRKAAIIAGALLIACGALAVMVDSKREKAIAAAKKHGKVWMFAGRVSSIQLPNRKAVDEVLPLLGHVPELRELRIGGVDLTAGDAEQIGRLTQLTSLRLEGCNLSGEELSPLENLKHVTSIDLIKNPLTDRGMQFLRGMTKLEKIDLRFTTIHGEGIAYLVDLPNLKELWLTDTRIDDTTVGRCAKLRKLQLLYVPETKVTADGLIQLTSMFWLTKLAAPDGISDVAREQIANAFIQARQKARAAGKDVPPGDSPPIRPSSF